MKIHPHILFDLLAYTLAAGLYFLFRRKKHLTTQQSLQITAGAILGAALGSVTVAWFINPATWLEHGDNWLALLIQGKTVVGGVLGGLVGVELMKKYIHINHSTGDDFVFPLIVGISVGRIGCFLTGLQDNTYGIATRLPWGVDFGDGVRRHPTQIYDIIYLILLAALIRWRKSAPYEEGDLFKFFMVGYLCYRFFIEFLKPYPAIFVGLNMIQITCAAGLAYFWPALPRLFLLKKAISPHAA